MKGLLKRGDLDALLSRGASLANLPKSEMGFVLECEQCRPMIVMAKYEGDGVLEFRCPVCRTLVARIAVAEGRAQEDAALGETKHILTPGLEGRRN